MTLSPRSNVPGRMHWTQPFAVETDSVFRLKLTLRKVAGPDPIISAGLLCFADGALNNGSHPDCFARVLLSQTPITSLTDVTYQVDVPVGDGVNDIRPGTDQVYLAIEMENQAEFKLIYFGAENISQAFDLQSQITELETDYNNNKASVSASLLSFSSETDALAASVLTLDSETAANAAAITSEITTRTNEVLALTNQLNTFTSQTNNNFSTVTSETATLSNNQQALGLRMDSVEASAGSLTASTSILQANVADLESNAASSIILRASTGNPAILELASAANPNGSVSTGTFTADYLTLGTITALHMQSGSLFNLGSADLSAPVNLGSGSSAWQGPYVPKPFTSVGKKVRLDIPLTLSLSPQDSEGVTGVGFTGDHRKSISIQIKRGSTIILEETIASLFVSFEELDDFPGVGQPNNGLDAITTQTVVHYDTPPAGNHTYSFHLRNVAKVGGGDNRKTDTILKRASAFIVEINN